MLLPLLFVLPWVGVVLLVLLGVRLPPPLPPTGTKGGPAPRVSVIIPARDEAHNIQRVLRSVCASTWPDFEVIVVDDRSDDGTGTLARRVAAGNARRVLVVDGAPLPEGWLGKPWACWQGVARASGEVLLFTDADTVHGPALLGRATAALDATGADAVTVAGRQLMGSFWERLVQPQVFLAMLFRFRDQSRPLPPERWRDAIANGQYLMMPRATYDGIGGHEAVRDEVVEDLRLAQILVRGGRRLEVRMGEEELATRMYRDLGELVRGWSKNVVLGGVHTVPPRLRPLVGPSSVLATVALWLLPPLALVAAMAGVGGHGLRLWAGTTVGLSTLFWCGLTRRFGAPWPYGALHPLGAAVWTWILLRGWLGMRNVEWKGRRYRVAAPGSELPGEGRPGG